MKICTSYRQFAMHKNDCDQFRYTVATLSSALEMLEENPDKSAIIEVLDIVEANLSPEKIYALTEENPRLFFDFYRMDDYGLVAAKAAKPQFYYHYPASSYAAIHYIMSMPGAAGITIMEPLTFDMDRVRDAILSYAREEDKYKPTIRMVPYIGMPLDFAGIVDQEKETGINHFWVLPQHIHLYEDYVDYIDIMAGKEQREHLLVRNYLAGTYLMPINVLFNNVFTDLTGNFVEEEWAKKRMNCRQTCMIDGWRRCTYCQQQDQMYHLLKKRNRVPESVDG